MPLTDLELKGLSPKNKQYKKSDSEGLYVLVKPNGTKLWRLKYYFLGTEKTLSIGVYPKVGLKEARKAKNEAKILLSNGIDPSLNKKSQKLEAASDNENTFKKVSEEYLETLNGKNLTEKSINKNRYFAKKLYPYIGTFPVSKLEGSQILSVLKKFEKAGIAYTAKSICAYINRVFRYAFTLGYIKSNPAFGLTDSLATPIVKNRPAILDKKELIGLFRNINEYNGLFITKLALKLLPLIFTRTGELRKLEWSEFDEDQKCFSIPAEKMKMRRDFKVPLSKQALEIINELKSVDNKSKFLFPSISSPAKPMSENTINGALRRMGYTSEEMCGHGFRTIASSYLHQCGRFRSEVIETQLAHIDTNSVRSVYNRTDYWDERVKLMQYWSDFIDNLAAENGE